MLSERGGSIGSLIYMILRLLCTEDNSFTIFRAENICPLQNYWYNWWIGYS